MDTKSKKLGNRTGAKIIAFFLCVALLTGAVVFVAVGSIKWNKINETSPFYSSSHTLIESIRGVPYEQSMAAEYYNSDTLWRLVNLFESTRAVENEANPDNHIDNIVNEIFSEFEWRVRESHMIESDYLTDDAFGYEYIYYGFNGEHIVFDIIPALRSDEVSRLVGRDEVSEDIYEEGVPSVVTNYREMKNINEAGVKEAFIKLYDNEFNQIREMIRYNNESYTQRATDLLENSGADYFITDGKTTLSNVPLGANKLPKDTNALRQSNIFFSYVSGAIEISPDNAFGNRDAVFSNVSPVAGGNATIYLAFSHDAIAERAESYGALRAVLYSNILPALILLILSIVVFIWLIVVTGRKREDGTRRMYTLDRIFIEIKILFLILTIALYVLLLSEILNRWPSFLNTNTIDIFYTLTGVATFACGCLALWFILSIVRDIKSGMAVKRSLIRILICKPIKAVALMVKSGIDGTKPFAKTMLIIIIFVGLVVIGVGIWLSNWYYNPMPGFLIVVVICAFALYFAYTRIKKYENLKNGVEEIASGNLKHVIQLDPNSNSEFDNLSRKVNTIGAAIDIAVENELKNQRLKTDLISNVSHDLKTPLTSIITYTDLLKNEGLTSPDAGKYLNIIDEKSRRLQKLTEDLFEAAKASSGAMSVLKEKVDLLALIKQEIAEMNDTFENSNLDLIINANDTNYYVCADSQLLWRVVDNLLTNVRKYAMPGSRVYIDLQKVEGNFTLLQIKNVSKDKLNIPVDELMERFKRGDEARTSEGSGLGLAIAKDLVRLQGGIFEVEIDGDLFKTITKLESYLGN